DKHVREHSIYEVNLPSEAQKLGLSATDPVDLDTGPSPTETAAHSPAATTPAPQPVAVAPQTRTPDVLLQVERALAEQVGPLAKVLVKKAHAKYPGDDAFMQELVQSITGGKEQRAFLRKLKKFGLRSKQPGLDVPSGPVTGPISGSGPAKFWDDEELAKLEDKLAEHVGPLAKVLVKKAARGAASREELHRTLAAEIDGEKQQRQFLRSVG
ncbi:MAG: hypothetical protein OEN20_07430, partial [Gammaproteobacteria bacterium]|nr:hypothetical protein [Gammaproteobacteria bacterium]